MDLSSSAEVNKYRKQHGNVKQIFMSGMTPALHFTHTHKSVGWITGKFDGIIILQNSLMSIAPQQQLEASTPPVIISDT